MQAERQNTNKDSLILIVNLGTRTSKREHTHTPAHTRTTLAHTCTHLHTLTHKCMHTHTNTHTRIQIRHSTHTQTHSHRHTHKHINTHTHVHTPILRLSRTHYFFVCYSPSLHTHSRTLKQNKHTHKHFKTQIHTHTQTYRYVARMCDEMCLQARKQGRERREPK